MLSHDDQPLLQRLTLKTLDQVFTARAQEGLSCSLFEAQALTDLVKEVYLPFRTQYNSRHEGQLAMVAISADEPPHKPHNLCKMERIVVTLFDGERDEAYRQAHGIAALRKRQIVRITQEALDQGAALTAEDLAYRVFNCGLRTISRDLKDLGAQQAIVPIRSQQQHVKQALIQRFRVVDLYMKGHALNEILKTVQHTTPVVIDYVITFCLVAMYTSNGYALSDIALLMQLSQSRIQQYQTLFSKYQQPHHMERIEKILQSLNVQVPASDYLGQNNETGG